MTSQQQTVLRHTAVVAVLSALALALFMTTPTNGDFWWFDASRHAMNGVFLRDFLLEGGLLNPIAFAKAYYLQYPAINIGFYPPFLYLSSVPFLTVFGASHAVSQAVVTLYALGAGVMVYLICQQAMDKLSALATALAIMAMPAMALWARQVQLDVPAVALLLATAWALIRYLQSGRSRWLMMTALFLGLAMLTRMQAGYAAPAVGLLALFHKTPQRPPLRVWIGATALFLVLALPSVGSAIYFSRVTGNLAGAMPDMPALWSIDNWTWYAQEVPGQVSMPVVYFIVVGLIAAVITTIRSGATIQMKVGAAFALSSWIFFTVVSNKEPRFNLPSLPFLFMLAAFGIYQLSGLLARVLLVLAAAWLCYLSVAVAQVPVADGFREAARLAQQHTPPGQNVLISAHRDGSFVFDMRTMGNRRDIGVRRADKLFVEINIMRQLGIKDQNLDRDAVKAILDNQHVAVVVAQTGYLGDQRSMQEFQKLLDESGGFKVVGRVAMRGEVRKDEKELVVYARE
jgi:hypothetical protein